MRKYFVLAIVFALVFPQGAYARVISKAETRKLVKTYAKQLHVPSKWLVKAAIDIIYTGRHESGGDERAGKHHACKGIVQFDGGWHATKRMKRMAKAHHHEVKDWRLCAECSLYRFVKSYHDGGRAAIRRHWAATLGR